MTIKDQLELIKSWKLKPDFIINIKVCIYIMKTSCLLEEMWFVRTASTPPTSLGVFSSEKRFVESYFLLQYIFLFQKMSLHNTGI